MITALEKIKQLVSGKDSIKGSEIEKILDDKNLSKESLRVSLSHLTASKEINEFFKIFDKFTSRFFSNNRTSFLSYLPLAALLKASYSKSNVNFSLSFALIFLGMY